MTDDRLAIYYAECLAPDEAEGEGLRMAVIFEREQAGGQPFADRLEVYPCLSSNCAFGGQHHLRRITRRELTLFMLERDANDLS